MTFTVKHLIVDAVDRWLNQLNSGNLEVLPSGPGFSFYGPEYVLHLAHYITCYPFTTLYFMVFVRETNGNEPTHRLKWPGNPPRRSAAHPYRPPCWRCMCIKYSCTETPVWGGGKTKTKKTSASSRPDGNDRPGGVIVYPTCMYVAIPTTCQKDHFRTVRSVYDTLKSV